MGESVHDADPSSEPPSRAWIWALALSAAMVAALLVAGQTYLSMLDHGHSWWRLFAWQFGCWSFWAAVSPWVLRGGADLLHSRGRRSRFVWRHLIRALSLTAAQVLVAAILATLLQPFLPISTWELSDSLATQLTAWSLVDLLVYGLLVASGHGLAAFRHARRLEVRESRLEAELARAQLEALRLEIQPHFLFNALNSVAALVRRRANDRALEMILGLSELLRSTLERSDRQEVSLREELDLVRRYVALQQARFSDRLQVHYAVDERGLELPVPTLVLQPLVENAIRHGIAGRIEGGRIEIGARMDGHRLSLHVLDDGAGLPQDFDSTTATGVGLRNTRSRLEQLYGSAAELVIRRREAGGTEVRLSLPRPAVEPSGARSTGGPSGGLVSAR